MIEAWAKDLGLKKNNGRDLHREAACRYYQVPYEEVTQEQRMHAKRALYVYLYSGSPYTPEELVELGARNMELIR